MILKISQKEINYLLQELKKYNWKKILIQAAEGLIGSIPQLIEYLNQYQIYIDGQPCFGACDIPNYTDTIDVDGIIHLGHNKYGFESQLEEIPIIFLPIAINFDTKIASGIISKNMPSTWEKVRIVSTVQHITFLPQLKDNLTKFNSKKKKYTIKNTGQILGCNYVNATTDSNNIDGIILIAGGDFHAKQLPIHARKPTLRYDPFNQETKLFSREYYNQYYKKRYAALLKARTARTWGILVSTKTGQQNLHLEILIKQLLTKNDLESFSIIGNTFDPQFLLNFSFIDAWINTACPRLASDDNIRFKKPVISFEELKIVLNEKEWSSMIKDFEH